MMTTMNKNYSELSSIKDYIERFRYLKIGGTVGHATFGEDRYLNQVFYKSPEWESVRNFVIVRDNGCDLGIKGYEIGDHDMIIVHHIIPITAQDILDRNPIVLDPDNLICVTRATHNAIHYGGELTLRNYLPDRKPGDTCPWK